MFKFDIFEFSYDYIMTFDEVKKKGILYDEEKFSFESYWENGFNHYERLFYTDEHDITVPFSGLCYELYPNGNIHGYDYYNGGYKEGEDVEFYDNGNILRYENFIKAESKALIIEWSRDGIITLIRVMDNSRNRQKVTKYDIDGNIIEIKQ